MKKILFLWLITLSAFAQKTIELPYREGNTNALDMSVYFGGQPVKPGSSLTVTAELRASDVSPRVVASIPMTAVDTSAGLLTGTLPYLQPNVYYLGLYFRYSSGIQFRTGVSRVNIRPAGSLNSTPDATGLNVQISEQKVVPTIYLDATPSSSIAAYYANQAKNAVRDSINAFSLIQQARDDGQDSQIGLRLTQTQADLRYKLSTYAPSWTELAGKPTLFSGSYSDLTNKPTIPTVAADVGAVSLVNYNSDKSAQGIIDTNQNSQISQKAGTAQVANNAALQTTGTPTALTVYEVVTDANTGTRGYYFKASNGEIYWIAATKIN